jgi:hypothetical protein
MQTQDENRYVTIWMKAPGMWLIDRSHAEFYAKYLLIGAKEGEAVKCGDGKEYAYFTYGINPNDNIQIH